MRTVEGRGKGILRGYIRLAILRRTDGDMWNAVYRLAEQRGRRIVPSEDRERAQHFKDALATLTDDERVLVVGHLELFLSYDHLAMFTGRATREGTRQAFRRALKKLVSRMPGEPTSH